MTKKKKKRHQESQSTEMDLGLGPIPVPKSDPSFSSFKSKRYRDKLRTEIKGLEQLLPVEKTALHRKLDSQTVFRLAIAYFRTKLFLEAAGKTNPGSCSNRRPPKALLPPTQPTDLPGNACREQGMTGQQPTNQRTTMDDVIRGHELLQAMDGFLLVLTSDGTILFVSRNILHHLGFNQVDLMMRCMYGIVHPDDHQEIKMVLEQTLATNVLKPNNQQRPCCIASHNQSTTACRTVSFLCRMKCFNGTTTGYLKMHCIGHMMSFPKVVRSQRTSNHVLFAFCRPFISMSADPGGDSRNKGFWSKHELDLRFRNMDEKITEILGHSLEELEGKSMYELLHPEDLAIFKACHKALTETEEIQTMYFRLQHKEGQWLWLHTRGKVVFKNSKKYSIVFTHCPVREEDSSYIQQEVILRQRYALHELMYGRQEPIVAQHQHSEGGATYSDASGSLQKVDIYGSLKDDCSTASLHDPHGQCPSSWHTSADRHSPVFPNNHLPHQSYKKEKSADGNVTPSKLRKTQPAKSAHQWVGDSADYTNYGDPNCDPYMYYTPGGVDYTGSHFPNPRQYHMHINGVGFGPYPMACPVQCPSTTLVFQGHVTAFEPPHPEQCMAGEHSANQNLYSGNSAPYGPGTYWAPPDGSSSAYQQGSGYANNNYLSHTPWEGWERSKMAASDGCERNVTSDWQTNQTDPRMAAPAHGVPVHHSIKEERTTSSTSIHVRRNTDTGDKDCNSSRYLTSPNISAAGGATWRTPVTQKPPVTCAEDVHCSNGGATYMQIAEGVTISTTRSIQKSETYIAL